MYLFVCMYVEAHVPGEHTEVRGRSVGVSSLQLWEFKDQTRVAMAASLCTGRAISSALVEFFLFFFLFWYGVSLNKITKLHVV